MLLEKRVALPLPGAGELMHDHPSGVHALRDEMAAGHLSLRRTYRLVGLVMVTNLGFNPKQPGQGRALVPLKVLYTIEADAYLRLAQSQTSLGGQIWRYCLAHESALLEHSNAS